MSGIEQANGIEIPESVIDVAAKAMVVREAIEQGRSPEEAELRWQGIRDDARWPYRLNAQAVLDALGATVEQREMNLAEFVATCSSAASEAPQVERLVTPWREVP